LGLQSISFESAKASLDEESTAHWSSLMS